MNLGFIGTGKIASSIIYGIFKSSLKISKIYISSRNVNIAKKLKNKFSKIKIVVNNQEIIDKSNVIFLSVTPSVGKKILNELRQGKTVLFENPDCFRQLRLVIEMIERLALHQEKEIVWELNSSTNYSWYRAYRIRRILRITYFLPEKHVSRKSVSGLGTPLKISGTL